WSHMLSQSPLHHVSKVATPVLMQNGQDSGATQLIGGWLQGLRHFRVPCELALYPRSGHGLHEPRLKRQSALRDIEWFAFWCLGERVDWLVERFGAPEEARARVRALRERRIPRKGAPAAA